MRVALLSLIFAVGLLTGCSSMMDARGPEELCEIHHSFMQSTEMPGTLARVAPGNEYLRARARFFPHSQPFYLPYHFRRKYRVYLCRDCIIAEHEWRRAYPDIPAPGALTVTPW